MLRETSGGYFNPFNMEGIGSDIRLAEDDDFLVLVWSRLILIVKLISVVVSRLQNVFVALSYDSPGDALVGGYQRGLTAFWLTGPRTLSITWNDWVLVGLGQRHGRL